MDRAPAGGIGRLGQYAICDQEKAEEQRCDSGNTCLHDHLGTHWDVDRCIMTGQTSTGVTGSRHDPLAVQQPFRDKHLRDLHGVRRCALSQIIRIDAIQRCSYCSCQPYCLTKVSLRPIFTIRLEEKGSTGTKWTTVLIPEQHMLIHPPAQCSSSSRYLGSGKPFRTQKHITPPVPQQA